MPLYDYKCPECSHVIEVLIGSSDASAVACPSCSAQMRRQVSAPSFRLKGGGWYETDFKSDNRRNVTTDAAADKNPADKSPAEKSLADKSSSEKGASSKAAAESTGKTLTGKTSTDKGAGKSPAAASSD